jgi:hypothetical protein
MILFEPRTQTLIASILAGLAITFLAYPAVAQLQIPKHAGEKLPPDPAREIAKQSTGLPRSSSHTTAKISMARRLALTENNSHCSAGMAAYRTCPPASRRRSN